MANDHPRQTDTANIVDLLFTIMPMVADHVADGLEDLGMTTNDYWALRSIDGPMPMKELATCMNVDASYVTLVADRLETLGLVERQPHPVDRRVKNLVLTAKGRTLQRTIPEQLWTGPNLFSSMTERDRVRFVEILTQLAADNADRSGATLADR